MRALCWLVVAMWSAASLHAQNYDVVLRAMHDELQRNAKELSMPNREKPFFIMYGLVDQHNMVVSATLGSIVNADDYHSRNRTTVRVLVGSYEFNDESLEDNLFSLPGAMDVGLPLDDDYWGIRRSFWATTDNVYRSAARNFEKHKQTLQETGKPLSEIPHRWFAQVPVQKIVITQPSISYNRSEWEVRARELSAQLTRCTRLTNSVVYFTFTQGHRYLVSTEGHEMKIPFSLAAVNVYLQGKDEDGKFMLDQISYQAKTLDKLPAQDKLKDEIDRVIKKMEGHKSFGALDEEYNGPVLLEGMAVAQTFATTIMQARQGIFASDNISKLKGFQFEEEASADGKLGKPVMNTQITIKAKPKLKHYNGIDLLGSFLADNEGVAPPDELTVVENGTIKNLLNNRTLTHANQKANGFANGPGVLEVTVAQNDSDKSIREKLLAQAKKKGLSFALILREAANSMGMLNAYKVDVTTGKEELLKNTNLREMGFKTWKRILGATASYQAHNLGGGGFGREMGPNFTSWIVPSAILLEEAEVQPVKMPSLKEEEYITSPLKSN